MKLKTIFKYFIFLFLIISCTTVKNETIQNNNNQKETTVVSPDMDEMIGQMIMVGFRGFYVNDFSQIAKDIKAGKVGGVVLFDYDVILKSYHRNIKSKKQLTKLIAELKKYSKHPLFVSVDQEGGKVCRLKEKYGFPKTVSQKYLGTINDEDTTRDYAGQSAKLLNKLGFNINFSPVVDVDINADNPVIGKIERSFSENPKIVADNAGWMLEEYHKNKIFGALKHFPGHGSSKDDSHKGLTDVTNTWQESELEPYKQLIKENKVSFIMTAHIFNSKLDSDYPATLSKNVLTDLLRNKLNYQGIIITDDMDMKAISDNYGFEQAINLAINAGADILLFANNLVYDENIADKVFNTINKLVKEGKIDKKRIEESFNRINKFKSDNL